MATLPAANQHHEPFPLDPIGQRLCETFSHRWDPILGVNDSDPHWQTITKYPLRPRVLWRYWQDANQLIGLRFDDTTRYALIDIDCDSPYHPAQGTDALRRLRTALETIGIYRSILTRSSWSGGLHLYLPLSQPVPTFGLALALKQCFIAQGLLVEPGKLEIFPNCKAWAKPGTFIQYNAHRLPLQPASGSCLLDEDSNPASQDLGKFFEQWDTAAAGQDLEELHQAIATAKSNRKTKARQKTIVAEWQQDLKTEIDAGWTGYGQTNHLLKTIACYGVVFEGLSGDALAEFVERTAVSSPGYAQWCRHHHEINLRATVWAHAAAGYYWALGDNPKRTGTFPSEVENNIVSFNAARSTEAQQRIRAAVSQLEAQSQLPATATARAKAIAHQGNVSLKTLYRHLELWHPLHSSFVIRAAEGDHPSSSPVFSGSSKTDHPDPDLTSLLTASPAIARSPEPLDDGKFYTKPESMKGSPSEIGQSILTPSSSSVAPRRNSISATVTVDAPLSPLQLLLLEDLKKQTVTTELFPQPFNAPPNRVQIEMICTQALHRGDRSSVQCKLQELWNQGWHEELKELLQLHTDWQFRLTDQGVSDAT